MITKDSKDIVVADDSNFFRNKLSDILCEAGHRIRYAKDGSEVIRIIKTSKKTDLLVLDLQMPEIDGFGVLKWINGNGFGGKFPILVITGVYEEAKVKDELKSLNVDGFLSKDFSPEQVIFKVNRLLFADRGAEAPEKRTRIAASIPVDYTFGNVTSTAMIINISEGGVFVHTDKKLPEGLTLDLKFSVPGTTGRVINAKGIVRWFPQVQAYSLFCGCGVMFTFISDEDTRLIRNFIDAETAKLESIKKTNKIL